MNIFETAVKCIDASVQIEGMEEQGNFASQTWTLIDDFRSKYGMTGDDFGNDDAWETASDEMSKDSDKLEREIMLLVWGHIEELMLNCGAGDVATEVFASQILDIKPSWEIKDEIKGAKNATA